MIKTSSKSKYFLNYLIDEEYEVFYKNIYFLATIMKKEDTIKLKEGKQINHNYNILTAENNFTLSSEESKCKTENLKKIFESLSTMNENLLSINNFNNDYDRKLFIDRFFMDLFFWGCIYNNTNVLLNKKNLFLLTQVNIFFNSEKSL